MGGSNPSLGLEILLISNIISNKATKERADTRWYNETTSRNVHESNIYLIPLGVRARRYVRLGVHLILGYFIRISLSTLKIYF